MPWSKKRKSVVLAVVLVSATLIFLGLAGGCYTTTRPSALTQSQRALIKATHLPYTVGVKEGVNYAGMWRDWPAYSDDLVRQLRRTGLFARVDHLGAFKKPPDLVARAEDSIVGDESIPWLCGLTLGLVPDRGKEISGVPFSLSRPGGFDGTVPLYIRYVYTGETTLGWAAVFLNASPSHTWHPVDKDPRFLDHFALEIVKHRREIRALAEGRHPGLKASDPIR